MIFGPTRHKRCSRFAHRAGLLLLFLTIGSLANLPAREANESQAERYLSPLEMAVSPDGRYLYVVCENSNEVRVLALQSDALHPNALRSDALHSGEPGTHASSGPAAQLIASHDSQSSPAQLSPRLVAIIPVGRFPRAIALSADGKQAFVSNSWDDSISVINTTALTVVSTLASGFEPTGVLPLGNTLYVANRLSNDVSLIDIATGRELKRLQAGRGASYLAASPDGKSVYVTHIYPNRGPHRSQPESELTVIDAEKQTVRERVSLKNAAGIFHVAMSGDGRLGVAAQLRPKNLIPLAHVEHGWVFGDSLTLFGPDVGNPVQVPLDELDRFYALPWAVALTRDKSKLFVTNAGSERVTVINVAFLLKSVRSHSQPFANDLSASAAYVVARVPVGHNPRGLALSPDGRSLFVANRLDDNVSVIDTRTNKVVAILDLGGPKSVNALRRGERLFYTADFAFQGQFGCASCHLDATIDGLQWDLEPDGFGKDIVDNRSLEDLAGTQPFKWNGGNPDLPTECGPRTEKFFYRSQSYDDQQLADLVGFVYSLRLRPNRFRLANGDLTPAQERGRVIFERSAYKNGKPIPESNRCGTCHKGPKYTNQQQVDVGTGKPTDRSPMLDVPHLTNVIYSAPYLHDGSARTLEEIWTIFNPKDTHGVTNDLTKDELNDLIEYLKTL